MCYRGEDSALNPETCAGFSCDEDSFRTIKNGEADLTGKISSEING